MLDLRSMYLPDLLAWRTWRNTPNFWMDMEHLCLALLGENGELAEINKKERFKPNWEPKRFVKIDELGDIWYYARILGIHCKYSATQASQEVALLEYPFNWMEFHYMISHVQHQFSQAVMKRAVEINLTWEVRDISQWVKMACHHLRWSVEQLTLLNWWKLEGGKHGWPDKAIDIPAPGQIMESLGLTTGDFEHVYQAHRALGRTLNREWTIYAFGEEMVTDA